MLPQTFELKLFDTQRTWQLTGLLLLGGFVLLGVCIGAGVLVKGNLGALTCLALLGAGGYAGWQAFKRAALVPMQLTVAATELRIEDLRPDPRWSQVIRLADVTAYRYGAFQQTEELRLSRVAAAPLKLQSASNYAANPNFGAMVAAFEQAAAAMSQPAELAIRRKKSFFEKRIATYLFVAFTLLLLAAGYKIFSSDRPLRGGNVLGVLGGYLAYLAAWRAASSRRNAP